MPRLNGRVPIYRLHKASGQAMVTLNSGDHYLGPHGSETSKILYDRLVAEWLSRGRQLSIPTDAQALTIDHVIHAFWQHAQVHYRRADGTPTEEIDGLRQALRPLRRLYGQTLAADFGPLALKSVRENMITLGWCRTNVNKQIGRLKLVFRWAVENELIPASVHHAMIAVRGLQRGRSNARESTPVRPAPEQQIQAVQPFVSRQVWALIQLQLLTGARAGELIRLRGVDLNTSGDIWVNDLEQHKTSHHGHAKRIYFGPQAQVILREFLTGRSIDAYLFSPVDADAEHRAKRNARRKTSPSCGNRPGTNRRQAPKRSPMAHYTVASYRRAIERACDQAFPPAEHLVRVKVQGDHAAGTRWETILEWKSRLGPEAWKELIAWRRAHRFHPHQLRHNAATHLRKEFGIEIARVILGHRSASITEIYAEVDDAKAKTAIRRIG